MSSFLNFGFYPTTKRATRLNSTNPINSSLIDHTWTNLDNLIDSNIILTDISDHFPCLSTFKNANPIKNLESITLKLRDLKKDSNILRFIDRISEVDFDFIYSQSIDLETKFEMFIAKFWSCFKECFPLKTKNISTKKFNNP